MCCNEGKGHFPTSTQILESVFVPGHNIEGMSMVNIKGIKQHFWIVQFFIDKKKTKNSIEFKVILIHRKQFPLHHNTILIYAMKEMDW